MITYAITFLSSCSSVGGVALRALFGLDVSSESTESKTVGERDDKLEAPSCVVSILQQHLTDIEDSNATFSVFRSSLHEVISLFGKSEIAYQFGKR